MTQRSNNFGALFLALLATLLLSWVWQLNNAKPEVEYSRIRQLFMQEKVVSFTVEDNTLTLRLREEINGSEVVRYDLYDFNLFYEDMNPLIEEQYAKGVILSYNYQQNHSADWLQLLLPWILAAVMIAAMWYFMAGRGQMMGGGADRMARFGAARVRTLSENDKRVTFEDVAGADEEKEELAEIVDFLKDPEKYVEIGARIPKGVLLVGPPGTGKTLLAKAVAGEAQVGFLSISGSDFVELYVGVGASRVRDLFEQAKKTSPAIVFIDEIDAVGRQRGAGLGGGHDEREQTLNQLLVEMDGFSSNEGVVVLAATNRADVLDPALLRPGRFDRQIYVGLPDIRGREEILQVHSKGKPLSEDVDLHKLAQGTAGFTGADLENLVNEGALLAARQNRPFITMDDLKSAEIKVIAGPEKRSRVIPQHERELTAWHEAGHAVVMYSLPGQDPVSQISIVPRGTAGGMTISLPEEDRSFLSRRYMEDKIVSLLGGRVAEQLCIGDISTGASNDLQRATEIARKMVASYGMSDRLGAVAFDTGHDEVFIGRSMAQGRVYSESVAAEIDQEIKSVLANAYSRCESILKEHRKQLDSVAKYLLEHETMEREAFVNVMQGVEPPATPQKSAVKLEKEEAKTESAKAEPSASDNGRKMTPALSRILNRNGKGKRGGKGAGSEKKSDAPTKPQPSDASTKQRPSDISAKAQKEAKKPEESQAAPNKGQSQAAPEKSENAPAAPVKPEKSDKTAPPARTKTPVMKGNGAVIETSASKDAETSQNGNGVSTTGTANAEKTASANKETPQNGKGVSATGTAEAEKGASVNKGTPQNGKDVSATGTANAEKGASVNEGTPQNGKDVSTNAGTSETKKAASGNAEADVSGKKTEAQKKKRQ